MARGGSKVLTGIIAFILGFLFAVIVEIGVISIVINYALYADLDNVFKMTGVENKDEDGKYIYINTSEENGGVKNVMQLINKLQTFASDYQNLTLGQIDEVLPVAGSFVEQVRDALESGTGVTVDVEELKGIKYSELSSYFNDFIRNIGVAPVIEKNMSADTIEKTPLLKIMVYGRETDYVDTGDARSPVYYDVYREAADGFVRAGDGAALDKDLVKYLAADEADEGEAQTYKLYFYRYAFAEGMEWFATDADFAFTADSAAGAVRSFYGEYSETTATLTGRYYEEDGEKVLVEPVKVGEILDDPTSLLYDVAAVELLGDEPGDIAEEILGGVSVGELVNGEVNFDEVLDSVKLTSVLGDVKADDAVVVYLCYNVTGLVREGDLYTGTYHGEDENGESVKERCFVETDENGVVTAVYYGAEKTPVESTLVKDAADRLGQATEVLAVADLMDVDASDSIMMYLAYGITGLDGGTALTEDGSAYTVFAGEYEGEKVYVKTALNEEEKYDVLGFYADAACREGKEVEATTVDGVSEKVSGMTDNLALADVIDIAYAETSGSNIMSFLAYSLTDVEEKDGAYTGVYHVRNGDGEDVEIACSVEVTEKDGEKLITGVYYTDENGATVWGEKTKIGETSAQIDRLTSTLKIKDLVTVDPDDRFMVKLGEYKIDEVFSAVDNFELIDFMDIDPTSAIMIYIAYDVTDVREVADGGLTYTHTGKDAEGNVVYIATEADDESGKLKVKSVYADEACTQEIAGVTVKNVPDQVSALTSRLKLVDVVDLDADMDNAIMMYVVYGVTHVEQVTVDGKPLTIEGVNGTYYVYSGQYKETGEDGEEISKPCYMTAVIDEEGKYRLADFWQDEACTLPLDVPATTIESVTDKVETITEDLTIGELIPEADENRLLSQLKGSTINSLSDDIETLAIQEIYADEIYGAGADGEKVAVIKRAVESVADESEEIAFDSDYLYYTKNEDGTFTLVNAGTEKAGKLENLGDGSVTYYTYGRAVGTWKFMLQVDGSEQVYTVNNLQYLMTNATKNIGEATLFDLAEAEIIAESSLYNNYGTAEQTAKELKIYNADGSFGTVQLGSLTIVGLIEAVDALNG